MNHFTWRDPDIHGYRDRVDFTYSDRMEDGDVTIVIGDTESDIDIPGDAMKAFIACYVRHMRIEALKAMSDEGVLTSELSCPQNRR